jgi:predicted NBD/HSP70 family sugar kinase
MSRSDLARSTDLGVPTVHRLMSDLLDLGLVTECEQDGSRIKKGRPALTYRLRDGGVVVAGVDVGNGTTRFAVGSASGRILTSSRKPTGAIRNHLVAGIVNELEALLAQLGVEKDRLAGIGIGVSAVVDRHRGRLLDPPVHANWHGLELGALIEDHVGCRTLVRQDNHMAAIAEAGDSGTLPGADHLVLLEIGAGIGAAMMVHGEAITGAHGGFGRIASWPVTVQRPGVGRSTLGVSLVAGGLVEDYHRRHGVGAVTDGLSLFDAASAGDPAAISVVAWAGKEIAELAIRLHRLCDPVGVVLGGGLARGFDVLEPHLRPHLPMNVLLAPSVLGEGAVLIGSILSALGNLEAWLTQRVSAATHC